MVSMYDKDLVFDIIGQIIDAVETVEERCKFAKCEDDFMDSKEGQEKLDGICMKLIAVGGVLKKLTVSQTEVCCSNILRSNGKK